MIFVDVEQLDDGLPIPTYQTEGSGGFDLYSTEDVDVYPGSSKLIKTGIKLAIPPKHVGVIKSRSSLALKGLEVGAGVVDSDYRGEVKVLLNNLNSGSVYHYDFHPIRRGDRIAQMLIIEQPIIVLRDVYELDDSDRGTGGFGSTGR